MPKAVKLPDAKALNKLHTANKSEKVEYPVREFSYLANRRKKRLHYTFSPIIVIVKSFPSGSFPMEYGSKNSMILIIF